MGFRFRVYDIATLQYIEYGVCGDLIPRYPKPYSIYLRGTIDSAFYRWLGKAGHTLATLLTNGSFPKEGDHNIDHNML